MKEATPSFVQEFHDALHKNVKLAIERQGDTGMHIFERQWSLHVEKTGYGKNAEICVFRLLEDDYHTPFYKNDVNNLVVVFGFQCAACGRRHEVKVYR